MLGRERDDDEKERVRESDRNASERASERGGGSPSRRDALRRRLHPIPSHSHRVRGCSRRASVPRGRHRERERGERQSPHRENARVRGATDRAGSSGIERALTAQRDRLQPVVRAHEAVRVPEDRVALGAEDDENSLGWLQDQGPVSLRAPLPVVGLRPLGRFFRAPPLRPAPLSLRRGRHRWRARALGGGSV